jgi:BlaI family penicillinase repressor
MDKLTAKEEDIMMVLWELERAFVKDIVSKLSGKNHYNTISTIVRNLEDKGYVAHQAFGKTHQYFPVITKEQ